MLEQKIFGYDFEVFSKINWWCVTFVNYNNQDEVLTIINNRKEIVDFYNQYKEAIFIGYNSRQYDMWIFKALLDGMNVGNVNDRLITFGEKGYQIVKNGNKYPINNYDVILKDKSLKQLEAFLGSTIKETEVPFDIDRPLTSEEVQQTITYNIHDVKETLKVLNQTKQDFEAHLDMIEMFNLSADKFNKTKAQLASHILGAVQQHTLDDEFEITIPPKLQMPERYQYIIDWYKNPQNMSYKLPLKSEATDGVRQLNTTVCGIPCVYGYGGLHGSQDNKIFEGIIAACDVASLYPALMINEGYTSRKLANPDKFKEIKDRRLELKKAKDKRQQPLKIVINSAYGILKDRNSPCFDPLQSNNVCLAGQWYLTELAARMEGLCEVLQINTDGIYVLCPDMETVTTIQEIAHEWEQRTKLDLEWDVYPNGKLVQKDVNNYILLDKDTGKYKCKGGYVKSLSPIDYDMPIINKALINYFVNNIPVEQTIQSETNLIEFQKVIKLTNLYKGVVYGTGKKVKVLKPNGASEQYVEKVMVEDGVQLKEKVHRVFASNRESDKGIYKVKIEKGQKSYEKVANTPERCFIFNESLEVDWYYNKETKRYKYNSCITTPEYLDRQYYIDLATERVRQFLEPSIIKEDITPTVLFECFSKSDDFYSFLEQVTLVGITDKVLEGYLIADCCNKYGKTGRLLKFRQYFKLLYGKDNFTVLNINKKITEDHIMEIIMNHSKLSKSGKKYENVDYARILQKIFDSIPNVHISEYDIMSMQIEKFNTVRYTNPELQDNRWFVLNTRNVVKPNLVLYQMKTGITVYAKVKKDIFDILPLQDGDIIDVTTTTSEYGMKSIGKDEFGINILSVDISKEYQIITGYEIVSRHYDKNTKLLSEMEDD
ncbi:MAG: hypothetical protein RSF40_01250 [Oscillospiraceae bacterium]